MYAHAVEWRLESGIDGLDRSISRQLVPALRTERGFSGALSLVDRAAGAILLLVFWETEEEARRPLAGRLAELDGAPRQPGVSTVWEVDSRA